MSSCLLVILSPVLLFQISPMDCVLSNIPLFARGAVYCSQECLEEIQTRMTTCGIKPEEFEDRIIFMSVFNDIDWTNSGKLQGMFFEI